jgi:hypothetical protein
MPLVAAWRVGASHRVQEQGDAIVNVAQAASGLTAVATGDRQILLRWIIPIGALYGAFHFTQDQQAKARKPHKHATAGSDQG